MAVALTMLCVLRYTRAKPPADKPAPRSNATTTCRCEGFCAHATTPPDLMPYISLNMHSKRKWPECMPQAGQQGMASACTCCRRDRSRHSKVGSSDPVASPRMTLIADWLPALPPAPTSIVCTMEKGFCMLR